MAELLAGAELDLGGSSISALVDLSASLNDLKTELAKMRTKEESYQQRGPVRVRLRGQFSSSNNKGTTFAMNLGGPAYGRIWEVRRVVIGGSLWSTMVGGTAELYTSTSAQNWNATEPPLSDLADQAGSLPVVGYYSAGQLVVRHPQQLHVVILSPTSSTEYLAGGVAFDLPDVALAQVVTQ